MADIAAAGAGAAQAAAGAARPPQRPGSLIGLLLNVGFAMMLYQFAASRRSTKSVGTNATAAAPLHAVQGSGADSLQAAAPPLPAAAPASEAGSAGNLFAMMGVPDPSKFSKGVPPELAGAEAARAAALGAVPPAARLYPLWRPGQRFSLFIYLSTSATPIEDWSEAAGVAGAWGAGRRTEFDAGADDAAGHAAGPRAAAAAAPAFSLFGGMMQRMLATSTGTAPAVRLRNASFALTAGARLLWAQRGLALDWAPGVAREQSFAVALPAAVLRNESGVYAHMLAVAEGAPPAPPGAPGHVPGAALYTVHALVSQLKRKRAKATFSLLGSDDSASPTPRVMAFGIGAATPTPPPAAAEGEGAGGDGDGGDAAPGSIRYLPHWRPTLHVQLVGDGTVYPSRTGLPPHIAATMHVDGGVAPPGGYLPLGWVNDFWLLQSNLVALNETMAAAGPADGAQGAAAATVPLTVSYSTAGMMTWSLQATMASQWAAQEALGTSSAGDSDIIKTVLLETNPVLLAVTATVSMLHMVFEFLAFRADVSFWRAAKSMEGVSVRSLFVTLFSQAVILLYLLDNDTSYMILFSSAIGLLIEGWKLRKAVSVKLTWPAADAAAAAEGGAAAAGWRAWLPRRLRAWLPVLDFADRDEGYSASKTAEYDDIAIAHMLLVAYPLLAGYATYSLLYERHRSWYSWVLNSLTGYIYAFGFVQMTPQIYINYRLKSVAHLPWRALVYKTLNTFVDDLFSFVIKMPVMHRIACLRDDVIFIILIAQRWKYPIDATRRNEFGTSAADVAIAEARKRGEKRVPLRGKFDRR